MKTKITNQQWDLIDLDHFKQSLPELKFCEQASIEAIVANEPTDLIQYLKSQNLEGFNKRLTTYTTHLQKTFQALDERLKSGESVVTRRKIL